MIIALNKIECVSVGGTFVCADLIPPTDYAINGNLDSTQMTQIKRDDHRFLKGLRPNLSHFRFHKSVNEIICENLSCLCHLCAI